MTSSTLAGPLDCYPPPFHPICTIPPTFSDNMQQHGCNKTWPFFWPSALLALKELGTSKGNAANATQQMQRLWGRLVALLGPSWGPLGPQLGPPRPSVRGPRGFQGIPRPSVGCPMKSAGLVEAGMAAKGRSLRICCSKACPLEHTLNNVLIWRFLDSSEYTQNDRGTPCRSTIRGKCKK